MFSQISSELNWFFSLSLSLSLRLCKEDEEEPFCANLFLLYLQFIKLSPNTTLLPLSLCLSRYLINEAKFSLHLFRPLITLSLSRHATPTNRLLLPQNHDTPLHIAAAMGRRKLTKIFMQNAAEPAIKNKVSELFKNANLEWALNWMNFKSLLDP